MKAKFVNESLNEDLSFAPHDLVIAVLGAISIYAIPLLSKKIREIVEAKKLRVIQTEARALETKKRMILNDTLRQLKKDKQFVKLLKDVTSNPVEGKEDMFLKGRRFMKNKSIERQPIRKDKMGDYQAMQGVRGSAIEVLQEYLENTLTDNQKLIFEDLLKTYSVK